jgi:hypothetical protein
LPLILEVNGKIISALKSTASQKADFAQCHSPIAFYAFIKI